MLSCSSARLAASCATGPCPPPRETFLVASDRPDTALLVTTVGDEARPEPLWLFDARRTARTPAWIPYAEWIDSPRASDCDGDGLEDPGRGALCATSGDWFAKPSTLGCDPATASLACPSAEVETPTVHELSSSPGALFAARGGTIIHAFRRTIERLTMSPGLPPERVGTARLDGPPSGVVLRGSLAFVGTTRGVEVFSMNGLQALGTRWVGGSVRALCTNGMRLFAIVGRRLWVLDASSTDLDALGSVLLPAAPLALAATGSTVVATSGAELVVVSVQDPSVPEVVGRLRVGGGTEALRAQAGLVYGVKRCGESYVVDVSTPADPVPIGEHDVADWVRGAEFVPRFAVRRAGRVLQVAEVAQ
jgi:hypothetical protein